MSKPNRTTTDAAQQADALLQAADILDTKANAAGVREAAALRAGSAALAEMARRIAYGNAGGWHIDYTTMAVDDALRSSDTYDHA
jgi:hypothetical protein